jgi:hypothetical protein
MAEETYDMAKEAYDMVKEAYNMAKETCIWQKRPMIWQKRPMIWQKRPITQISHIRTTSRDRWRRVFPAVVGEALTTCLPTAAALVPSSCLPSPA